MSRVKTVLTVAILALWSLSVGFFFLPVPSFCNSESDVFDSAAECLAAREERFAGFREDAERLQEIAATAQLEADERTAFVSDYLDDAPMRSSSDSRLWRELAAKPEDSRDALVLDLMKETSSRTSFLEFEPMSDAAKRKVGAPSSTKMLGLGIGLHDKIEQPDETSEEKRAATKLERPERLIREMAAGATIAKLRQAREAARSVALSAKVAFELAPSMVLRKEYPATFLIQEKTSDGETPQLDQIAAATPTPTRLMQSVQIQAEMRASISAADFATGMDKGGWQLVSPDSATIWNWRLKPNSTGTKSVIVFLEQKVRTPTETYIVPVANFPQTVEVEVTMSDWILSGLHSFWERFWPAIVGLFVVLAGLLSAIQLWDRFRSREKALDPSTISQERTDLGGEEPPARTAPQVETPSATAELKQKSQLTA